MNHGVVLFHTTSAALRAEKILVQAQLVVKLIPTPREFSSDCGIAVRFEWNHAARVKELLDNARVEVAGINQIK
jgi:hypothetical protein